MQGGTLQKARFKKLTSDKPTAKKYMFKENKSEKAIREKCKYFQQIHRTYVTVIV
jgi:hypothetical protein